MNDMKEISVIVPIYNVEKYLKKCLQSLQNQNFESYEVILVDDGSTDNSRKIAEKYVEVHRDTFTVVAQENKGLSEARNTGMQYAKGRYICFVDSDDYVEESYLQEMYLCAEKTGSELVFCAFRSVDEKGNLIKDVFEQGFRAGNTYKIDDRKDLLLTQNAAWNKLYKKEIIDKNDLKFTPGAWYEDLRFVKKYMLFASKFAYCDLVLYNYLIRQGSIMNSMSSKRNVEIVDAIDEVTEFYKTKDVFEVFREEIEFLAIDHIYISALVRLIRSGDKKQFEEVRREFLKRFPEYKNNKYLGQLDSSRKVVFGMLNVKAYKFIKLFFCIKDKKRGN